MQNKKYDLIVIGGGAAGMLAAGTAASKGKSVLLVEKNKQLGVKLLITGKGRCNITNAEENSKILIQAYGKNGRFLYPAFQEFSNFDTIDFFEKQAVKTKIERGQRVFPKSDKAQDIVGALKSFIKKNEVDILLDSAVQNFSIDDATKTIQSVSLENGTILSASKFLIATGGKSYPQTGSTGDAYSWLSAMGHTIVSVKPALTPILVKENYISVLEGLALKNVSISLWNDSKKIANAFGEAIFTKNGLSGPIILDLSNIINEYENQKIILKIDFKPALDSKKLDNRILRDFDEQRTKLFKNSLNKLLPKKLIPLFITLSKINPEKKVAEISKIERKKLLLLFKEMEWTVDKLFGFEKAIVTAGGVSLKEINPKTMQSKIIHNLYIAGEVLDIDGPTGGYNLQVAWSTGVLAGKNQ